ncbi:gliding motility-associated C-terminal domain-containing protein, partial [Thalassobellus citreus]|uniref:gliding motility-associated C-terminal domain-containing protein n=1 Tax=Thalassobellus citreus TaxID=3367752 RepID=UPI0037B58544
GQTYNLFDLLTGEDQTGTWSDDDSSGALSGNTVTLDGLAPATYNFTYNVAAIGICDDVDVTVQIIINDTPAPTANTPQEFCDSATVANLVTTSGTSIQWYDAATGGNLLADVTDLVDGQIYYATQTNATTGCESSMRTAVTATIYQSPNAGAPNSTGIVSCNDSTIDLNSGLDGTQDLGGTWYEGSDNTGTVVTNPTAYDVSGFAANNYQFTYYVVASAPCVDDSETISVTIEGPLNAGTDGLPLELCSNDGTIDLFTQLQGSPETGGVWSPAMASTTGVFDPLVDPSGTYIYSLTNACGTFSSQIEVTVSQAPNAGVDDAITICVIDGLTDLFPLLGTAAQSGGVWSPALTSGTGEFDPSVDVSGIYTYTVAATVPCSPNAVAQITVTVDDISAPIVVEANPEFCLVDNPIVSDLSSALTLTGTVNWYEDASLTIVADLTDNLIDGEDYYATQTNSTGCESSTSIQVTAIINDVATPTLEDLNKEYCINDNPAPTINDLTLNITERDTNNVVWYDAEMGGNIISSSTELSNLTSYYAVLVDATTGCESSIRLEVTPDITSCGKLDLPDGFSPNNDGVNDTFDYNNLDILYPNFEIEIFNRYGNVVYKGNASTPRFNGKSNQSRSIGNGDLPVGVYFYIFKFNDNTNKPEQGRLYLSR